MDFEKSIAYLVTLGNEVLAMKLGLENIGKLLNALDNPERKYSKIQIAGTNGKGSTCVFLDSICRSAGIKTGLYTSPHLISITERIKIGGREISEKSFAEYATKIKKASESLVFDGQLETVPTFFEQITAIALCAFAEAEVELAILETGLGGRFDATTAANADIVAITPIDFDHQNILGESLRQIAAEKAAIIRRETPVIVAPQSDEAKKVILNKCREVKVEPIWANEADNIKLRYSEEEEKTVLSGNIKTENKNYLNLELGLAGRHQFVNASVAVRTAELLAEKNLKIAEKDIRGGLKNAVHKGRLEFYKNILFDGAHNAAGAKALRNYLDEFINRPITLIFGAMRDKDLSEMAEILFPQADRLIFTKADNPRSLQPAELMRFLPADFDKEKVDMTRNVKEALILAGNCSPNGAICITGSLYLVGEAQKLLNNKSL